MFKRAEPRPVQRAKHKGRIYRSGWGWRYRCTDCDYGAGSTGLGLAVVPLYIGYATQHAREYGQPTS